ncbi:uncharacterized protein LOC133172146 isoform X2 [Saccostrea echinata]|uniref:uncharacterized protein LOC133172146 isoform X2 n=1 Tax=Saccostrea echinata TaxID=191078 RepID=UPI002A835969|nr:uncharacterized protein LOC133172146 isoform X2 [Saccostrea echinata]
MLLIMPGGDSYLSSRSYSRRGYSVPRFYDDTYIPRYVPHRQFLDTTGEENAIRKSVNRELMLTSNFVDDAYDLASSSHRRDEEILKHASQAIPTSSTENEPLPTTYMKASAPPKPFRRFQTADSYRGALPQDSKYKRGISMPPSIRSLKKRGPSSPHEWSSQAMRALACARNIRESVRQETGGSLTSSPVISPYQSPRASPEREFGDDGRGRSRKPKPRLGKHFSKLLELRRRSPSVQNYGSGIDSEVASDDVSDYDYQYRYEDEDDETETPRECFYIVRNRSPSPEEEYVPFAPRRRVTYDDDDDEGDGYRSKIPDLSSDFSITPYTAPKSTEVQRSAVSNDLLFHKTVAETAARARKLLAETDLDEYETASLVLSVEGEYKDPEHGDLGFQYISRPLPLKGPMLATGPGTYAVAVGTDTAFDKYFKDMRSFREEIRARLDCGYRALNDATRSYRRLPSSYSSYKALPFTESHSRSYQKSYPSVSYRKRLEDGSEDQLVIYPMSQRSRGASPVSTIRDVSPDRSQTVAVYESGGEEMRISTLDKIKIKAALVGSKVDVVLPNNRRPRSKYAAAVIREINLKKHWGEEGHTEPADMPTSHLHASPKPVYLSRGSYFDDYEDIVKKPKSDILSWKHRLESRIAPKDLLFTPRVYANVRSQLRDVQEKMDRHRQLMDRYLEADSITTDRDVKTKVLAMYSEMEERDPLGILSTATTRNSAPITESSSIPSVRARTPAPSTFRSVRVPDDELSSIIIESSETSINATKESENSVNTTKESENSVNATKESENSVNTTKECENSVNTTKECENSVNTTNET